MLRMYTHKSKVPNNIRIVRSNDAEFIYSGSEIPDTALVRKALEEIEGGRYFSNDGFVGKFSDYVIPNIFLSTGCKAILNIIRDKETCFPIAECGVNAERFILENLDGIVLLPNAGITRYVNKEYLLNDERICSYSDYRRIFENAHD